jgi:DNA-binding NarL/FixJ family response regulator
LIASQLYQKTGKECFIVDDINNISKNHIFFRFVLWDCQKTNIEEMRAQLRTYNTQKKSDNHIVLFNVPVNLKFQNHFFLREIHGLFYEHDSLDNFIKGIQAVITGKLWFPREMMTRYILEGPGDEQSAKNITEDLTPRQIEILSLIAVGETNQMISEKLCISPQTVKNHLYNTFKIIKVSNRTQASLWAAINLQ